MQNINENMSQGYLATLRLMRENPKWFLIIKASLIAAKKIKGDFAGSWVLSEAKKENVKWFPNLRTLVSHGILQKTHIARAGKRAYYIMPDIDGVEKALNEIDVNYK